MEVIGSYAQLAHLSPLGESMTKVVHTKTDPNYVCYCCTIDINNSHRSYEKMMSAFYAYERVVEYIENLPKWATFSRVSVWTDLGRGVRLYSLSYFALRDMAAHGIIECASRSKDNKRCMSYRKLI